MNRLERMEKKMQELETKIPSKKKTPKLARMLMKFGKKADKKQGYVLVQYLNIKQQISFKLCRIVGGDQVVIDNKVHTLNPKDVWRYKKTLCYIVREIDRKPVSNQDYNEIARRGDDTCSDVPLIKAVLGAVQKPSNLPGKSIILWILGAVVAGIIIFSFVK